MARFKTVSPTRFPTKLDREPLVEAIFELRFQAAFPVSSILPGVLFPKIQSAEVQRLPMADLPEAMRHADPNYRYVPLVRIRWGEFLILIGDYSFGISCVAPYPGWQVFKHHILELVSFIQGVVQTIERYSIKCTDIFEHDLGAPSSVLDLTLNVGPYKIENELFQVRVEVPDGDALHIIQITSSVTAVTATGSAKSGLALDIDSIVMTPGMKFDDLRHTIGDRVQTLHEANKAVFFESLTTETLNKLGPHYD